MRLIATIAEKTFDDAVRAVERLPDSVDGVELRLDTIEDQVYLTAFRYATKKTLILTNRSTPGRPRPLDPALLAEGPSGRFYDFVDVELTPGLDQALVDRFRDRVILSHHDFEGCPDLDALIREMASWNCAYVKLAVTPSDFRENQRLLERLVAFQGGIEGVIPSAAPIVNNLTMIGMGERGLYSRILAPFFGSQLIFVSPADDAAAPGQLSLSRALAIYGQPGEARPPHNVPLFAVAGNPAGHSGSPAIHNRLFRERGVEAAYSIASVERFDDVVWPFAAGAKFAPRGLSITAPFKEEAFAFAEQSGAIIRENAAESRALNTLVRVTKDGRPQIIADNTDVDAFTAALAQLCGRERKSVALIGAGGTARAALVALRRAGMHTTIFNRTASRAAELGSEFGMAHESLDELHRFDGEIIINATSASAMIDVPEALFRSGHAWIDVDYSGGHAALVDRARAAGMTIIDGLELLTTQAMRQNELFLTSIEGRS